MKILTSIALAALVFYAQPIGAMLALTLKQDEVQRDEKQKKETAAATKIQKWFRSNPTVSEKRIKTQKAKAEQLQSEEDAQKILDQAQALITNAAQARFALLQSCYNGQTPNPDPSHQADNVLIEKIKELGGAQVNGLLADNGSKLGEIPQNMIEDRMGDSYNDVISAALMLEQKNMSSSEKFKTAAQKIMDALAHIKQRITALKTSQPPLSFNDAAEYAENLLARLKAKITTYALPLAKAAYGEAYSSNADYTQLVEEAQKTRTLLFNAQKDSNK